MFCEKCGQEIDDSEKFCSNCGASQKSNNKLLVIICILLLIVIGIGLVIFLNPKKNTGSSSNNNNVADDTPISSNDDSSNTSLETSINLTVGVYGANYTSDDEGMIADASVFLYEGHNNTDGTPVYEATNIGSGKYSFENISSGDYTIKISTTGYVSLEDNISIDTSFEVTKYLVPIPGENDVIFKVEWNGDRDIDLCFFNATTGEYTSVGNPMDSLGSFIYADNSYKGFELVYLRDFSSDNVRTVYVADSTAISSGQASQMEADGVKVTAYNSSGLIYTKNADSSKNSPIWSVAYIYNGAVYDDGEAYIDDVSKEGAYAWAYNLKSGNVASDDSDKNNPPVASNEASWKALYYDLLKSKYQKYTYDDQTENNFENKFTLCYMDGDDIPELICLNVCHDYGNTYWESVVSLYSVQKDGNGQLYLVSDESHMANEKEFSSLRDNRFIADFSHSYFRYIEVSSIELKNGKFKTYAYFTCEQGDDKSGTIDPFYEYNFSKSDGTKESGYLVDFDPDEYYTKQVYGYVNGKAPKETKLTSYNYDQILDMLSK